MQTVYEPESVMAATVRSVEAPLMLTFLKEGLGYFSKTIPHHILQVYKNLHYETNKVHRKSFLIHQDQ